MKTDTTLKEHFVLDREYSNELDSNYETRMVINAIETQIEKKMRSLNVDGTIVDDYDIEDFPKIPKFSSVKSRYYNSFISKSQNWTGHITKINENNFEAKLIDKDDSGTFEVASFDFEEVSPGDKELLSLGALFYWSVGYFNDNGQVSKKSVIRFKRTVLLTEKEIDSIADKASYFDKNIKWD